MLYDWCPCKKSKYYVKIKSHWRRKPCDHKDRDWSHIISKPRNAKDGQQISEARRGKEGFWAISQWAWLCQHLDFRLLGLQKCWNNKFLLWTIKKLIRQFVIMHWEIIIPWVLKVNGGDDRSRDFWSVDRVKAEELKKMRFFFQRPQLIIKIFSFILFPLSCTKTMPNIKLFSECFSQL